MTEYIDNRTEDRIYVDRSGLINAIVPLYCLKVAKRSIKGTRVYANRGGSLANRRGEDWSSIDSRDAIDYEDEIIIESPGGKSGGMVSDLLETRRIGETALSRKMGIDDQWESVGERKGEYIVSSIILRGGGDRRERERVKERREGGWDNIADSPPEGLFGHRGSCNDLVQLKKCVYKCKTSNKSTLSWMFLNRQLQCPD